MNLKMQDITYLYGDFKLCGIRNQHAEITFSVDVVNSGRWIFWYFKTIELLKHWEMLSNGSKVNECRWKWFVMIWNFLSLILITDGNIFKLARASYTRLEKLQMYWNADIIYITDVNFNCIKSINNLTKHKNISDNAKIVDVNINT